MISFIWAEDKNHLIGNKGVLPWHLPDDMKFFKEKTSNHTVIMGRKTFESFPNGPLPNRKNVVLTRNDNFAYNNVLIIHSIDELELDSDIEYFVLGGAEIFNLFKDKVDRLYVTKIDGEFSGDTYMIDLDWNKFKLLTAKTGIVDEKNIWKHEFQIYERI